MIDRTASWTYTDDFVTESEPIRDARERAGELGVTAVSPGAGAALRILAAAAHVTAAVEVGTGTGVGSLWLLDGMAPTGVLTTIESDAESLRAAKQAFTQAGIKSGRTRPIAGRALEVMTRLADGAYDLVYLDADPSDLDSYVDQARRLLRAGGLLIINEALWHGKVADPAKRDEQTTAMRMVARRLREDDGFVEALLPVGDGLLVTVKR